MVMLLILYSSLTSLFFVTFPAEPTETMETLQSIEEVVFITDLVVNFFQSYVDPKTYDVVRDHYTIAVNYLNGWFLVDFISVFPF